MRIGFTSNHLTDATGTPTGGSTCGTGFTIAWQHGALGRDEQRVKPNGAFVEDVIDAVLDRIAHYQNSRFACIENAQAMACLGEALAWLDMRTKDREARKVEGTHQE